MKMPARELPDQLQTELVVTRRAGAGDFAERAGAEDGAGLAKSRRIGEVEGLEPELQPKALMDLEILQS